MKRIVSILCMAALIACMACACGSKGGTDTKETTAADTTVAAAETTAAAAETAGTESAALPDGVYQVDFTTDSSMFRVNEVCEGKGTLVVVNGEMTVHITLVSKNIVNLFPGVSEDAKKDGAELLQPTVDSVTYSDGATEEVYGFDVPVPVLDEDFDLALIGTKGKWYDHKVSVSNPTQE